MESDYFKDYQIVLFLSVPRSGHNAIMNWFMQQMELKCHFYSISGGVSDSQIKNKDFKPRKKKNYKIFNENFKEEIEILNSERVAYSDLNDIKSKGFLLGKKIYPIIILRSYRNHIASVLRAKAIPSNYSDAYRSVWEDHAKAIVENKCDFILFDKWHVDKEYRKSICDKYGLNFTDEGKEEIPKLGGAVSSFDHFDLDGNASKMDVLNRYKSSSIVEDKYWIKNYSQSIMDLEKKIFGLDKIDLEEIKELDKEKDIDEY